MDIDKALNHARDVAETARRESGGVVYYITVHHNEVCASVETDDGRYIYTADHDIGSATWYSIEGRDFAPTYREAIALPPTSDDGGEE
jgi:hypothetical protein